MIYKVTQHQTQEKALFPPGWKHGAYIFQSQLTIHQPGLLNSLHINALSLQPAPNNPPQPGSIKMSSSACLAASDSSYIRMSTTPTYDSSA